MQILPLVTGSNERSLNQFDSSLYRLLPLSLPSLSPRKFSEENKVLIDSREVVSNVRWSVGGTPGLHNDLPSSLHLWSAPENRNQV